MKAEIWEDTSFSNISVRIMNRICLLRLLYDSGSMTQLDIKNTLRLSGPTVTQTLQFFRETGLLKDGAEVASSGGRKPRLVQFCYDAFHAVGVEVRLRHVDICVVDLTGHVVAQTVHRLLFENSNDYWKKVNQLVLEQVRAYPKAQRILGVGMAFPGEISPDGSTILRSTVLGLRDLPVQNIQKHFSYPLQVVYGANAAGFGTVWRTHDMQDAVYIIVTNNGVAGSVILDGRIYSGRTRKAGAFGHIVLDPSGKKCFCGGRGCWSACCALSKLVGTEEPNLEEFFTRVAAADAEASARWETWLRYCAQALATIRLSFDTDIIIGGKIAAYLSPYLSQLKGYVAAYPALSDDRLDIRVDDCATNPMTVGAALCLVSEFLEDRLDGFHFDEL